MIAIQYATDVARMELVYGLVSQMDNPLAVGQNQNVVDAIGSYSMLLLDLENRIYTDFKAKRVDGLGLEILAKHCPSLRLERSPEMVHEFELIIDMDNFSTKSETGNIRRMMQWMNEHGRGEWSFDHWLVRPKRNPDPYLAVKGSHGFKFFFEDETTMIWFKVAAT